MTTTHHLPGLILTDHFFRVPLDHAQPDGEQIDVFARELVDPDKAGRSLPWLVFFQGGPGFPSPRPSASSGWIKRALQDYRVLLLDQRGTGRSTPLTFQTLARFDSPQAQAEYLMHFRADSIVKDAEWIRRQLVGENEPWSALGQSFGGFCVTHYLSAAPGGLREAIITGGLPPIDRPVDDVYKATYRRVIEKNRLYYDRYPGDVEQVQAIAAYLADHEVTLPSGGRLTPRRFQQLGMGFGASDGFEPVHYLLETAFVPGRNSPELSYTFLRGLENMQSFDTNPIYALLHEAEYCQQEASRWSAERVRASFPEFEISPGKPVYFTGEMIYPWMFDEYTGLTSLKEAAEILAQYEDWPRLYDKSVLEKNTVPCAAAVYYNDMYVERQYSEETAACIRGIKLWVTNEFEHDGLRTGGERLFSRLLDLIHGRA